MAFGAIGAAVALVGCSSASTTTRGGEPRFDAAPPTTESDASSNAEAGDGTTWGELHRDFFGPTGRASCAGTGVCHGAADEPGARASGYVCAPDRDGCYAGITNPNTKLVLPGNTTTPPERTLLHLILRKTDGTGTMPKEPAIVVFAPEDMARIDAWIRRGAPNDGP